MNQLYKIYNISISDNKIKVITFRGKYSKCLKTVVNENIIDQVAHFSFIECDIGIGYESDVSDKIHKFNGICVTIHRTIKHIIRGST